MYDFLHIHYDQQLFMKELNGIYMFKYCIIGPLTRYLGANVENLQL